MLNRYLTDIAKGFVMVLALTTIWIAVALVIDAAKGGM